MSSFCFQTSVHYGGGIIGTQIMPRDLKKSGQDLSNEGTNFILSPLVVGQPEITCLASSKNRARF